MNILQCNDLFTQEPHGLSLPSILQHCPCASATIHSNDAAIFHRHAQLGPFSEEMLY